MKIRPVLQCDLQDIARIQSDCYSDHFIESKASFSAKLSAHSDSSFMALQGELAVGYVVALPWLFGSVPDLNGLEYSIPPNADGLYIHDIAVARAARKSGVAERLLNTLLESGRTKGYKQVFLVAVQGAASYWILHDFEAVSAVVELRRSLSAYGEGAAYMARPLWPNPSIEQTVGDKLPSAAHVKR